MSKSNRRPQAPKGGNRQMVNAMMGKRSSNAAGPHKSDKSYRRKPKHQGKGWSE